jgi:hypothetical protein
MIRCAHGWWTFAHRIHDNVLLLLLLSGLPLRYRNRKMLIVSMHPSDPTTGNSPTFGLVGANT